jgi:hypothetical protein
VNETPLVLGPLLRYVDATCASIWVETRDAATVTVHVGDRSWQAPTFAAHDHHFALVEVDGLDPGSHHPYRLEIDGTAVWPLPDSPYPPSVIPTLEPGKPLRLAYGSCRTSVSHDEEGNRSHGVDALRAYALRMAGVTGEETLSWPDFVLFLGDQVYADETTEEMEAFIASRRDISEPPWEELKDFEEYAYLYRLAWTDPANRWLLSTLPSSMIFDDHDIRDDWNTSARWKQEMEATSWWHERIVTGLGSYWVYQHLGNLSPAAREQDDLWRVVRAGASSDAEVDLTERLDAFAARVDAEPTSYRWSYARDIEDVRLVVLDSRAARVLDPDNRSMLDPEELAWLDEHMRGGFRHLLVGTSLPFLLSPGLHHLEAWDEALVGGAWGRLGSRFGEWLRQTVDLEHWAAFQHGFAEVAEMALSVAHGERGPAPETVTFLSGDVHHSYISEVRHVRGRQGSRSRVLQAVCSPIRNPLPRSMRFATAVLSYGLAGPMGALAGKSAHVPDPPFTWGLLKGPWFDNNLGVFEDGPDGLAMSWYTGVVSDGDHALPRLEEVASVRIDGSRQPAVRETTPARLLRMGREALSRAWRFAEHRRPRRGGRSRRPR